MKGKWRAANTPVFGIPLFSNKNFLLIIFEALFNAEGL